MLSNNEKDCCVFYDTRTCCMYSGTVASTREPSSSTHEKVKLKFTTRGYDVGLHAYGSSLSGDLALAFFFHFRI